MKKVHFQPENGETVINGHKMSWVIKRSKTASAFGLRGSRIFYLVLKKDGKPVGLYDRGWRTDRQIDKEDEESALCVSYLVDKFGKDTPRKRKEMGEQE